ncbi:MAG: FHA domain-containing protein [Anaerolineae bacterium]|nr:FHA domain-containing protein [Anaerolineae bacterium]
MTDSKRTETGKVELSQVAATEPSHCPYCKKALPSAEETVCPHCNLPLKRRRRRQVTAHGGALARLVIHLPGQPPKTVTLTKPLISLGRDPDNLIQIDSTIVSRHHAQLEFTAEGHTLTDLASTNGTRVNGQRLTPHSPYRLNHNDIIRFSDGRGNSTKLVYLSPSAYSQAKASKAGRSYDLTEATTTIGRGFDATIVLSHPAISWHHAEISRQGDGGYRLKDVSDRNGTFLNGRQLEAERTLAQGDVIGLGPFNLIYQGEGRLTTFLAERNFSVEVNQLEKIVYPPNWLGQPDRSRPKTILHDLDLVINPREFVALVGGSGSGKSTLLKALIGLSPASGGTVLVNGDNLYERLEIYRHLIGYVPQDDIIHPSLHVRQALAYALELRLPQSDPATAAAKIEAVLAKVGLSAQAETRVADLSGGQRKRVSIAAELLADPWIFFLDEPTSGLDPGLEKLMIETLRQLADEGRTIVLVTHATNHIIAQCDQVAFMARGGELAYFGPPAQAIDFFQVDNFPDIYTVLAESYPPGEAGALPAPLQPVYAEVAAEPAAARLEAGPLWAARYRQSELYQTYIAHRQSGEIARHITAQDLPDQGPRPQWQQFKLLARRTLDLLRADKLSLWALLAVLPLIALFLLLISSPAALVGDSAGQIATLLETTGRYSIADETQTLLFMMALATTLLGLFGAAYEIINEAAVYRRERMISLRVLPYVGAKFAVLGGLLAALLPLFLLLLALKLRFPPAGALTWAPLEFYITLLLTGLAGLALGLFISASASSKEMVIYLVLIAILIQIVFSGAIFELTPLTQPLSYLTITRWSLEALGISSDILRLNDLSQVRVEHVLETGRGLQTLLKDVATPLDFFVDYPRHPLALLSRWLFLLGHILVWGQLSLWQMRRKDEI